MSLHRSCCPCGDCYDGVLCESCLEPCAITQPAATVQVSAREWLNHYDDLPGTGSGAVVYVNGAWYFFDGTTSTCETRAAEIDWTISFKADECPDYSVSLDIVVPFVGGFDFRIPWNVAVDCGGISDSAACAEANHQAAFPSDTSVVTSATMPEYEPWSVDVTLSTTEPFDNIYGLADVADYSVVGDGSLTQLAPPFEYFAYKPGCTQSGLDPSLPSATTTIEAYLRSVVEGSDNALSFRFVQTCPTGSYSVSLESVDADGYFVCIVNSVCTIRYIGPVRGFVNAFNATFAGTGIEAVAVDDDWWLGCKVRAEYVGTAYQNTFPSSVVSASAGSTTALGDEIDVTITDTTYSMSNGLSSFNATSDVVIEDGGVVTYSGPYCPSDDVMCGTGFVATASHWSGGAIVRERYEISLAVPTWSWVAAWDGDPSDPCEPSGLVWTVT